MLNSINFLNSSEGNCGSLSDTSCSGRPYFANRLLSASMVLNEVVEDI